MKEKKIDLYGDGIGSIALVDHMGSDLSVVNEETFGPVLSIRSFSDENDLIEKLHKTGYGLSASLFGKNKLRLRSIAKQIKTGNVSINSKDVQATLMGLNKQFDAASSVIRDDIVAEMSKLGKLTNMSAEAQGRFAMFANISGKNAKQITDETRQAVVLAEKESGLRLDINKILDEAGKITGQ